VARHDSDSLFSPTPGPTSRTAPGRGAWSRSRVVRTQWAVWAVETADTAYLPPFEAVRARPSGTPRTTTRADEAEGREYFTAHRADYKDPVRYVVAT